MNNPRHFLRFDVLQKINLESFLQDFEEVEEGEEGKEDLLVRASFHQSLTKHYAFCYRQVCHLLDKKPAMLFLGGLCFLTSVIVLAETMFFVPSIV